MIYALDTNIVIYYFKGLGDVASHIFSHSPSDLAIPAIVLYELERGLAMSTQPERRRKQLQIMRQTVRVLPFDDSAAQHAAIVNVDLRKQGKPIGPNDTLIAGTAMATGATLVTHNRREFQRVKGLQIVDWF